MKKRILVISQYFYPEQFRINDICTEWVKRGYEVTVITGIPNYPEGKFYEGYSYFKGRTENYNGVNIIRIPLIPRGKNSIMLVLNYLSFVISGYLWKVFSKIKADYVFIFEVSPMTQALPGVWYAKRNKIPCYIYVQDLWPENVEIITGIKNKMVINLISKMVDYIYKNCSYIFTTSRGFVNSILERNVPSYKVKYWPQYAEDFYIPLPNDRKLDRGLDIIFTGNIGEAQGLDILVECAKLLKNQYGIEDITYTIVGDGRYKDTLLKKINEYSLGHLFNFVGRKPAEEIPIYLSKSDIAFLSLNNNSIFSKTIPAKLQSYMACGKPILASADGETEKIVREANCGLTSKSGSSEELADNILKLYKMPLETIIKYGTSSREYYLKNFNKEKLMNELDTYFIQ